MFTLALLFTGLAASAFASPVLTEKRSADSTKNVPYLASVEVDGQLHCGAAIIGESWIVTSAKCLTTHFPNNPTIRVGNTVRESGGVTRQLESFKPFDGFGFPNPSSHNVAIAKLSEPLEFSDTIQPIALTELTDQTPVGAVGTISGWGTNINIISPRFTYVQSPETTVITDEECARTWWSVNLNYDTFCADVPSDGVDGYLGDYGTPLVIDGKLHGLQSLTLGYFNLPTPHVYSKVSYFRRWIEKHTGI